MKRFLMLLVSLCLVSGMLFANGETEDSEAEKSYHWKLGTIIASESMDGEALQMFADKVAEKSNGQMQISIGFNSAYGKYADQIKAISMGSLEMMMEDLGSWELVTKNMQIFRFPYAISGWDHYAAWLNSPEFKSELEKLEAKNHHMLLPNSDVIWKRGPFRLLVAQEPVLTVEDLEGLRLRLYESVTAKRIWKHLGCNITVVPWGEVYIALKQGLVEAATISASQFYGMKWHEVAPYLTNINEYLQCNAVSVDAKKWEGLPENLKAIVQESLEEVAEWSNDKLELQVQMDLDNAVKETGGEFFEVDLGPFAEKIAPLAYEFEEEGLWDAGLFDTVISYNQ